MMALVAQRSSTVLVMIICMLKN